MILVDTNVISELRKGARADPNVRAWIDSVPSEHLYLSVVVVGELRRGVELIRRRDTASATSLDRWLNTIITDYSERILEVTIEVAEVWSRFNVPDPLPVIDSLLAATAHVHDLTVATRNVGDIAGTGVRVVDPFATA